MIATATKVVNLRDSPYDVYIGRTGHGHDGYFGNPFALQDESQRVEVLLAYEQWFYHRIAYDHDFLQRVLGLRGKRLGCFCKPNLCHGDILVRFLASIPETFPNWGEVLAFTGHRPDKLGGFRVVGNLIRDRVVLDLHRTLQILQPKEVISGMALGVDQWAAEVAFDLGIPFVAAIPFPEPNPKWPEQSKRQYYDLISVASEVHVSSIMPYSPGVMQERNEWMVDNSDLLLAIWDGTPGGTKNCIDYARKMKKPVARINPRWPL